MKRHTLKLKRMVACPEAVEWADQFPSMTAAWKACERADWLLWYAGKTKPRKLVVLAACDCAATALKYAGDSRPAAAWAIRTARAWARGKASIKDVRTAADDAAASTADATTATACASNAAVYAAADAAYTVYSTPSAADAAVYVTHNAANAAVYAAAGAPARASALASMAKIVRKRIPRP